MEGLTKIEEFINTSKAHINQYIIEKTEHKWTLYDIYPYTHINDSKIEHIGSDVEDHIGVLYESMISNKNKKDLGQFYTREDKVINRMLDSVDLFAGKILEPSCGSGHFLVLMVKQIINKLQKQGKKAYEILSYVTENIYANDCDRIATNITELNLLEILAETMIEVKLEDDEYIMPKLKLFNYDFTQKNIFKEKFSLIIGNPPFVTMYGKRSRNMTEEKRAYFNTFDFVQKKNGNNKFNLSMFFIENGLKALQENGNLSFILDIAFFETAFIDIRRYIVKNYYIDSIITGMQEFEGVASGQLIINIVNKHQYNNQINMIEYTTGKIKKIEQKIWDDKNNKYKYYIPLEGIKEEINAKVVRYNMLDEYFPKKSLRTCCALTGKTEEFIVNPKLEHEHIIFPYIEGSKGLKGKFFTPTPERYIKYDYDLQIKLSDKFKEELTALGIKNKKRVTLGDKDAYLAPKIFIRQSATEIIATYCDKPYAANNSIYILTTKENNEKSVKMLKYTCGLLNSDLITFFCRINKIIRNERGKTPQIKISDLKNIRIKIDAFYFDDLIKLVDLLLKNPCDNEIYKKLNEIVYKIYSINDYEKEYINDYLSA